jgi:nucleoside-diphosphate-sugar epimerase
VEIVQGDVSAPESLDSFFRDAEDSIVFHLAGLIHPRRIRDLYSVNTAGTRNIAKGAIQAGARRMIYLSSNSPIGCNSSADDTFTEESPYNPYMNYGRSKMLAELEIGKIRDEGKIETVILRPCWFYGPGQPLRQSLFFRMIREGKAPIVGGGENLRSLSYVDHICQALVLVAESPAAAGKTYWVADPRPYSMNEIVDTVERLLEEEFRMPVRHKRLRLPGLASSVAYGMDRAIQGLGFYHQKIHVLSEMNKTIACSVGRLQQETGFQPTVELEEGMRRSIAWCLERGDKI